MAVGTQGVAVGDKVETGRGGKGVTVDLAGGGVKDTAGVDTVEDAPMYCGVYPPQRFLGKKGLVLRDSLREGVGDSRSDISEGIQRVEGGIGRALETGDLPVGRLFTTGCSRFPSAWWGRLWRSGLVGRRRNIYGFHWTTSVEQQLGQAASPAS